MFQKTIPDAASLLAHTLLPSAEVSCRHSVVGPSLLLWEETDMFGGKEAQDGLC
jgi:hypothetical protein